MTGAKTAVFKAIADAGKTADLAKTVASAAGFIPTSGTRQEGTPPCGAVSAGRRWGEGGGGGGRARELGAGSPQTEAIAWIKMKPFGS